jgi:hypothetical protein
LRTWRSCSAASVVVLVALAGGARGDGMAHGVCLAHTWRDGRQSGYGTATAARTLARLKALGVDAVSLTPFGYMPSPSSDQVILATARGGGESDAALAAQTRQAHAAGMRVVLKPHIWIRGGAWIGAMTPPDEAAWARWFDSYRRFIVHYAKLAAFEHMEALVLGVELARASVRDRPRWQAIIGEVRAAFKGRLLYAANWDEADRVVFWDLVDAIGVDEYQPLAKAAHATLAELRAAWKPVLAHLGALAARWHKPVVITEIGYRARADAATAPSLWPERDAAAPYDGAAQATCYRAALEALTAAPFVRGIYVWKWFTDSADEQGPTDFSPAGKPAEQVLGEFYRRRPNKRSR